ncbi:xanthine dehydrogenase small subunit [Telmatospirillum siberiense]|uniref:Xanthine dehydrogenase small subunit n=1 Tax=Telmatospirillum siberiense TaxID=382514 RepID=A0A2N3PVS1_9PROT|nr:xanthine dehydrogenase small subunit [Telmatospirillum siberiense]PKU24490.1 xanthine dehydrogenase small subunit [Telmatospirillum siberiense]
MRNIIITNINGRDVRIADAPPDQMALSWLRAEGFISVKEGCGEGDCGACTVVLGVPRKGGFEWREVASCLLFLPMLDGRALLTVEGLKGKDGAPHPVQRAMSEGFGTQCGFCSPGITMSLYAMGRRGATDEDGIFDGLAGNLCRCTGYRPILDIAHGLPALDAESWEADLAARLDAATALPLSYSAGGRSYYAPTSLNDAVVYRAAHPQAWLVAGGTDLGLAITKRHQHPETVLSLARVNELTTITEEDGGVTIGAAVPYAKILCALRRRHPEFARLLRRIGASQVRNQGTFGGNLGTASPIGDSLPGLIALDASLLIASSRGQRRIAAEDLVTGYRTTQLAPDEVLVSVHIPDLADGQVFRAYKVAKRRDQDISTVSAAYSLRIEDGRISAMRAAYGGVADRPLRARHLENALLAQPWTTATLALAQKDLARDIAPRDDFRGSADYRRKVAANLIARLWHETTEPTEIPVSLDSL